MGEIKLDAETGDIITTIQRSVDTKILDIKEDQYVDRNVVFAPRRELTPTLKIASLAGIVEYLRKEVDVERLDTFVQVIDPTTVCIHQPINSRTDRRFTPVIAHADIPRIDLNTFIDQEDMTIQLQSKFVETPERAALLAVIGNTVADEELTQEDDGVSQTVTLQKGIRRSNETIKNPFMLCPFRTFTEVDQRESPFVVRLRKEDGIEYALFEADGGAWRNVARQSIRQYILDAFSDDEFVPVVLA